MPKTSYNSTKSSTHRQLSTSLYSLSRDSLQSASKWLLRLKSLLVIVRSKVGRWVKLIRVIKWVGGREIMGLDRGKRLVVRVIRVRIVGVRSDMIFVFEKV